tara:strand:- start:504 stop:1955 length:1452 start_codon:yes stop_codon:yes gene_type:complete
MKIGNINTEINNAASIVNLKDSLSALDKIKWDPVFDIRSAENKVLGIGEESGAPLYPALRGEPDPDNINNPHYTGLVFRSTWDDKSPEFIPSKTFMQQFFGSNYAGLGTYFINSVTDQMNKAMDDHIGLSNNLYTSDQETLVKMNALDEYRTLSSILLQLTKHYIKFPPHSVHGLREVERMIRTYSQTDIPTENGNTGHYGMLRSFHSGQYKKLDNVQLVKALFDALTAQGIDFESNDSGLQLKSANIGEDKMYLKFVNTNIGGTIDGKDINYMFVASNSETSQGKLSVKEGTFVQICSNGMIRENIMSATHRGAKGIAREYSSDTIAAQNDVLWKELRDDISTAMTQEHMDKILSDIEGTTQVQFTEPKKVVETVSKTVKLSEKETELVYANLLSDESDFGMSQWALSNAVTKAAQSVSSYERSTELEGLGDQILKIPVSFFERKEFQTAAVTGGSSSAIIDGGSGSRSGSIFGDNVVYRDN